ncbi:MULTISPECIES: class I SAM-dependent methyltransferase [Prosthecochloris]|nr:MULTISPECIES: protein N-lysine methyltransferase family protein [Prosthecochloris]
MTQRTMTKHALKHGELSILYDELAREYDIAATRCMLQSQDFLFYSVRDSYALLDRISPEEFARDEKMPYWAEIWPSSLALAEFLLERRNLHGRSVIEIGSGVGVAAIAAARKGALVTATDYCEEALRFMTLNALQNGVRLECRPLDWRSIDLDERYDVLCAADVLYERVNLLPVISAIDRLLQPEGCALIADPRRRLAEQFLDMAFENGFSVSTSARTVDRDGQEQQVNIYRISRIRGACDENDRE